MVSTFMYKGKKKELVKMGSPKGKKHRTFSPEEKLKYIEQYFEAHESQLQYALSNGITYSCFRKWLKAYTEEGAAGLASHRNRCGNRYAALHTSKTLDEMGRLQLRMAKLEVDVARLKKGYQVKGSGSQKEFVTGSGKSFKSSKS